MPQLLQKTPRNSNIHRVVHTHTHGKEEKLERDGMGDREIERYRLNLCHHIECINFLNTNLPAFIATNNTFPTHLHTNTCAGKRRHEKSVHTHSTKRVRDIISLSVHFHDIDNDDCDDNGTNGDDDKAKLAFYKHKYYVS